MFDRRTRFITAATLFSATSMLTAFPIAAGAAEAMRMGVQTSDLNLATDAGRTVLKHRIDLAVEEVCEPARGRTISESRAYAACRKTAEASAAPQFDAAIEAAMSSRKVAVDRGNEGAVQ
jgi:UrcA family protein